MNKQKWGARLLSSVLVLVMVLSVLPATAFAAADSTAVTREFLTQKLGEDYVVPEDEGELSHQAVVSALLRWAGLKDSQLGSYPDDYNAMAESMGMADGIAGYDSAAACTAADLDKLMAKAQTLKAAVEKSPKQPLFMNGMAQPIFEYNDPIREVPLEEDTTDGNQDGITGAPNGDTGTVRYCVYVETDYDTDGDGKADLVKALVQIPQEAINADGTFSTIYEARPYITGCNFDDRTIGDNQHYDVDGMYKPVDGRTPAGTATTADAVKAANPDDWFYWSPQEDMYDYESLKWYDYFLVRGYAVVTSAGIGTWGSDGFETCYSPLEMDGYRCVIQWLTGERKAYTDKDSNIEIKADWSNGNVGMTGRSYGGTTPFALAGSGVKGLKTIVPVAGIADYYEYVNSQGLALTIPYTDDLAYYCAGRYRDETDTAWQNSLKEKYQDYLATLQREQFELNGDFGYHWAKRAYYLTSEQFPELPYDQTDNLRISVDQIEIPALIVHGLNDDNVRTKQFDLMYKAFEKAGQNVKLVLHQGHHKTPSIEPWNPSEPDETGMSMSINGVMYDDLLNKWFSHYLYDVNNGIERMPTVTVQSNLDGAKWTTYNKWETSSKLVLNAKADEETSTISSNRPMFWNFDDSTTANALYTTEVKRDTTVQGAIEVSFDASVAALGQGTPLEERDGLQISAMLVDVAPEGETLPAFNLDYVATKTLKEDGAWRGGGLTNYQLVQWDTAQEPYKLIAKGWMDLCNPGAGYESITADHADRVALKEGENHSYTIYLQPNVYTVEAGHKLALVIFPADYATTENHYTVTIDNSSVKVNIPVHGSASAGTQTMAYADKAVLPEVDDSAYYAEAALWAAESGTAPEAAQLKLEAKATRAQLVTWLWRNAGRPAPTGNNPFADVEETAAYRDAAVWAAEQGIVDSDAAFDADGTVTRAQAVSALWQYDGCPEAEQELAFTDVAAENAAAVRWAVSEEITNGTSASQFSPNTACTQAQVLTFLYRYMG